MEFNLMQFLFYFKLTVSLLSLLFGFVIILITTGDTLFNEEKFIFKKHFKEVIISLALFTLSAFLFSIKIIE